jgi:hypothetical protein
MIGKSEIGEIIATYQKHGWVLRRVLLSDGLAEGIGIDQTTLFAGVPVLASTIDAAWFSRPPKSCPIAWEIRYLGNIPFALLENMDEADPGFETDLQRIESLLKDAITAKQHALTSVST